MNTATLSNTQLPADRPAPGLLGLAERGLVPDEVLRLGIRRLCADRLRDERLGGPSAQARRYQDLVKQLRHSPLAIHTDAANTQHYELPADFFKLCLGHRLKYSGCYYATGRETLDQAESAMLELYGIRAELADGQRILELGCGWGSLTLWMAERYPHARITAVSNSASQRLHIQHQCQQRGLNNVEVITCDVNTLQLPQAEFDRCVSVEMFEHMRNYQDLLSRIGSWLRPAGKLFVHIFAHRSLMYPFETEGADNWLGRHFFTGGIMPSVDTLLWFQGDLRIDARWMVDGGHYERTANHWLANQDANRDAAMQVLAQAYGAPLAALWFQRWRMFWMACAELFGYQHGQEWLVAHYRFTRPD
ncbi:cyclopropane-fatty-acyl-phospholipid synthase family protein [Achromobacter seleniivolatilans]|uniref:Cyclopropane-fatty-acyl-phospholipid synthase family protein n=1 Tax=Achromobacter seleniivolatilans TaxID=3047478 RepID=A0ABY9M404_9BURK|nr:cyclopropane-fatty-acyl-phospholipid synthase family protein [Achromobacter sp. R39]WMD21520.1 cyclopropane-fatty-acyl-phospholipid synthase family protein [Achromobacter sp. R39]